MFHKWRKLCTLPKITDHWLLEDLCLFDPSTHPELLPLQTLSLSTTLPDFLLCYRSNYYGHWRSPSPIFARRPSNIHSVFCSVLVFTNSGEKYPTIQLLQFSLVDNWSRNYTFYVREGQHDAHFIIRGCMHLLCLDVRITRKPQNMSARAWNVSCKRTPETAVRP